MFIVNKHEFNPLSPPSKAYVGRCSMQIIRKKAHISTCCSLCPMTVVHDLYLQTNKWPRTIYWHGWLIWLMWYNDTNRNGNVRESSSHLMTQQCYPDCMLSIFFYFHRINCTTTNSTQTIVRPLLYILCSLRFFSCVSFRC